MGSISRKTTAIILLTSYLLAVVASDTLHLHGPGGTCSPGQAACLDCAYEPGHGDPSADDHGHCLACSFQAQKLIEICPVVVVASASRDEEVVSLKPIRRTRDIPSPLQSRAPPLS